MEHPTHRRWIGLAAAMVSIVLTGSSVACASGGTPPPNAAAPDAPAPAGGAPVAQATCAESERSQSLALEQRRILEHFADVRVLRDDKDLARLAGLRGAAKYSFPSHAYTSIAGMGFTVANTGTSEAGWPHLLLYKPNPAAANVTDAWGKDYPYELVGWGYGALYSPEAFPSFGADQALRCLQATDWFLHERSVHPKDTWQNVAVPPKEDWPGQVVGGVAPRPDECKCEVGIAHPRLWDIHFWIDPSGVPAVSMLNPGEPLPGFDPGTAFFVPGQYPTVSSEELWPGHGHGQRGRPA